MAKKNTPKKILAGAMALMSVAAYVPADGISSLVNNYSIVADAAVVEATGDSKTLVDNRSIGDLSTYTGEKNGVKDTAYQTVEVDSETPDLSSSDFGDASKDTAYGYKTGFSGELKFTSELTIGSNGKTTILNDLDIVAEKGIKIAGTVVINGGSIKVSAGQQIKIETNSDSLYLNATEVTRGEGNTNTDSAFILNQGNLYINASTVNDKSTYVYSGDEDLAAIRNTNATGKTVIGKGGVKTITGFTTEGVTNADSNYKYVTAEVSGDKSTITSTGAAIINGRGCELWVLGANISGTSKVLKDVSARTQGSVVPVVETSGTKANFIDGSITDNNGAGYAVVAMAKGGTGSYAKREVNFGDGAEADTNTFKVTGSVSIADMNAGDATENGNGYINVKVNKNATLGDVIMGLPGTANTENGTANDMKQSTYAGSNLVVDGGSVETVSQNKKYYSAGDVVEYTETQFKNNAREVGSVTVSDGTVGSIDIPVTKKTRDSVTISGGTVTNTANAAFYQHNYSLSIDKTSDPDNTIVTLSCDNKDKCDLKPVVLTFKNRQEFAEDENGYAVPTIKISGGTIEKEETIDLGKGTSNDKKDAKGITDEIKKAIVDRGFREYNDGTGEGKEKVLYGFDVKFDSNDFVESTGCFLGAATEAGKEKTAKVTFSVHNDGQSNSDSFDMKFAIVAPKLKSFTVTDPKKFLTDFSDLKQNTGDKTKYTITYNDAISKTYSSTDSDWESTDLSQKGVEFFKVEKPDNVETNKFTNYATNVRSKVDSVKIQFKKDGGEWADTAKDVGTYSVRYVLTLAKGTDETQPDPLYYYADYTIEIKKIQYNAGVYVDESTPFSEENYKIDGSNKGSKLSADDASSIRTALTNAKVAHETNDKVKAVKAAVGDSLGDVFTAVYAYSGKEANEDVFDTGSSGKLVAGANAQLYAVDVTTKQEYAATDALGKGVFEVRAKLTKTNANYELADEIIGYVVVSGISIADATVTLDQYTFIYDGSTKKPDIDGMKVEVKDGNTKKQLTIDEDFSVSGSYRAIKPGDYVFTITGEGDYDGTKEVVWHVTDVAGVAASKGVKTTIDFENNPTSTTKKLAAVAVRNVPKGYTVKEFGVLAANDANAADEKYLNLEVAKAQGRNEIKLDDKTAVTIVRGSTTKSTSVISSYSAGLSDDAPKGYAVRSYIKIEDAEGNEAVIYSDIKHLDKTEVKGVAASDKALAPKLQYEFIDGNVNRLKFTAIRKLPEDGGYTVEAMGILADSSSMSAEAKDGKSKFDAKALLIAPDDSNTYKGITTQKATVIGSAKSLTGLSASYSKSASFNDPGVEVTVRPYMVISKGGQKYYLYGEQIFIGKYDYKYDTTTDGKLDTASAGSPTDTTEDGPKLNSRQILIGGDAVVPTIKK